MKNLLLALLLGITMVSVAQEKVLLRLNYEKGDWQALTASPLPVEIITRAYLDAINWAKELNSQLVD
mgnify:CR=1 FL=1